MTKAEKIKLEKIDALLVGSGADDFAKLKAITDVFCPFEAIGMVHQEIRHAHFLAYAINPNRPHGFGTVFLDDFLRVLVARDTATNISPLDLHLANLSRASVRREWRDIDLLIEVPNLTQEGKGIIFAIELKINASEGGGQLEKYEKIVRDEFPEKIYQHQFVFLTKRGKNPSREIWHPVGLEEIVDSFATILKSSRFSGMAADTMWSYLDMQRRHHLPNKELEKLALRIWEKHGGALDVLMEHKPDLQRYLKNQLLEQSWREKTASALTKKTGLHIVGHSSTPKYQRFAIKNWDDHDYMKAGTDTWIKSKRLASIEVYVEGDQCYTKLVFGPSTHNHHAKLVNLCNAKDELKIDKRYGSEKDPLKQWTIMSSKAAFSLEDAVSIQKKGQSSEEMAAQITKRVADYWAVILPKYDEVVRNYDVKA